MKKIDEVINNILIELDRKLVKHQQSYYHYHNEEDKLAKNIHIKMCELCERIRSKMKE